MSDGEHRPPALVLPASLHLVGIGGAGMSALARLALEMGCRVGGSDREASEATDAVARLGATVSVGHSRDAIGSGVDAVIASTAIPADNPELIVAAERGIPIHHRADLLAALMRTRRSLVVAGAHGKSTTAAMLAAAMPDTSCSIGATITGGRGTGARWGEGEWFVAEGDESDRSLLALPAEGAILLNVDHDHHSTFATLAEVEEVFEQMIESLPSTGCLVVGPDARARELAGAAPCQVRAVDGPTPFVTVDRPEGRATLEFADGRSVGLELSVPGAHNLGNAAAAVAMADWCGVAPEAAAAALADFTGVGRRFEERGSVDGVRVVDDYAHHPAEIAATLAAAREQHPGRLVAVFQPHLYSRTRALRAELGAALGAADVAVVTDVYAAREDVDPHISGSDVAAAVPGSVRTEYAPTLAAARDAVLSLAAPGDLVLTLGAGDVTDLGEDLLAALGRRSRHGNDSREPRQHPA